MAAKIPRWFQAEARDAIWQYFYDGGTGHPLVALPTGTGKALLIADFIKCMMQAYPRLRMIKLTHVKELIKQNFDELIEHWPLAPAGIYSAGLGRREHSFPVTFAGIASVAKKAVLFGHIDFVIIDECHLLGPKESSNYRTFIDQLTARNPHLRVIGLTATPYRLGQGMLTDGKGRLFTDICYDLTNYEGFSRLIAEGYLCPLVPKRPTTTIDVSNVGTAKGDFIESQLQAAVDKDVITRGAVKEMLLHGADRAHWLVFAAGVEHCQHVATMLEEHGISAVAIHSKMGDAARDKAIADWKAGKFRCAVNNNILTTGINFPALDMIGFLRPTKSPVIWVQGLGRGTRPYPGKQNCLVLDFGGNTARLGTIDDPVIPSPKKAKGKQDAPAKCCPKCDTWNHTSVRYCVNCGEEFVAIVKYKDRASELALMSSDEPQVLPFSVYSVEYDKHSPRDGRPPSLKVTYHCDDTPLIFREFVALESDRGLVKHKARDWWRERCTFAPPDTVDEAIGRTRELATPKNILVWINTQYPQIMRHDFTGVGFELEQKAPS